MLSETLREHAKNVIDFEKKKNTVNKKKKRTKITSRCKNMCGFFQHICGITILKKLSNSINYLNVTDHCHYTLKNRSAAHSICNLKFNLPNKIHNDSNCDYHLIIKELANEFERNFECLGENTEKYKTFYLSIEKELPKIDIDGNESVVTTSYKIKFIDSAKFMATSLSNRVDNLTERIYKIKYMLR